MASKKNNAGAAGGTPPAAPAIAAVQTPASGIDGLVGFAGLEAAADELIAQIETVAETSVHDLVVQAARNAEASGDFAAYGHLHALAAGMGHLRSLLNQAEKDLPPDSPAIAALKRLY